MIADEVKKEIDQYEELISEILKKRNPPEKKKWWETTAGTAIITAAITVVTAVITMIGGHISQLSTKSRDAVLARYDSERTKKREFIVTINELIAKTMKSNEDILELAQGAYDEFSDEQLAKLEEEINIADAKWRTDREASEFQVYLYFGDKKEIVEAWNAAKESVQKYSKCAVNAYLENQENSAPKDACKSEMEDCKNKQAGFRNLLAMDYRDEVFSLK